MSAHRPQRFGTTTRVSVTAASSAAFSLPVNRKTPVTVRFVADVATHLVWGQKPSAPTAALTDALVPANCIETITVGPDDFLSIIGASGVTTGNAWFTIVSG
jgi:hypothetical protein